MIDTHAHINTEDFAEDRDEMLENAFESGVEAIIIPAIKPEEFDEVIQLTDTRDELYCAVGIHPHHAAEVDTDDINRVADLTAEEKVVAVGEIGLDYHYDFSPKEVQIDVFRRQLRIAKLKNIPAIIHNREADTDLLDILEAEQDGSLRGVLHCFSSPVETLKKAIGLGLHISFTGNITFKNTNLGDVVKTTPENRIMIETDSPYMAPVPHRGKRNDPSKVSLVAEKIAEYKSLSKEEVISMTTRTAKNFFKLFVIAALFALAPFAATAQSEEGYEEDEYYYEDDEYYEEGQSEEEALVHPYPKFFGFGPMVGTNTIIQEQKLVETGGEFPVSYEGIMAYGGSIAAEVWDYLAIELTYIYSKNTKVAEQNDYLIDPFTHQIIELTGRWLANPYNKINLYGITGVSAIFNSYSTENTERMGINVGIGAQINIPVETAGVFAPYFEWRLDFEFGESQILIPVQGELVRANTTQYFSIPRFGVLWYPDFLR
jgi:TatD DNase family protein